MTPAQQREFSQIQEAYLRRKVPVVGITLYPSFLEQELVRVRLILRKIDAAGPGFAVEELAREGLEIPNG